MPHISAAAMSAWIGHSADMWIDQGQRDGAASTSAREADRRSTEALVLRTEIPRSGRNVFHARNATQALEPGLGLQALEDVPSLIHELPCLAGPALRDEPLGVFEERHGEIEGHAQVLEALLCCQEAWLGVLALTA